MANIVIYTTLICPFCIRAKMLLKSKKLKYTEINVGGNAQKREEMMTLSGRHTVPQIFINEQPIGGCDELYALEQQGKLDELIRGSN